MSNIWEPAGKSVVWHQQWRNGRALGSTWRDTNRTGNTVPVGRSGRCHGDAVARVCCGFQVLRTTQIADSALPRVSSSAQPTACKSAGSAREHGRRSSRHARIAVRRGAHLIIEALLLAAPTREMDGDVGGCLDRLGQDLHDLAIYLLLLRGRQFEISRDGR